MDMTILKARLYDLLDEIQTHKNQIERLEEIIEERDARIEELEEELHKQQTILESRARMIRDLARENRKLRDAKATKEEVRKEVIEEINEIIQRSLDKIDYF
jgi:chromosome segregation ATPase